MLFLLSLSKHRLLRRDPRGREQLQYMKAEDGRRYTAEGLHGAHVQGLLRNLK